MKKLFLLLTLLGMVATGCSKDEGGSEDNILNNFFIGLDNVIISYTSSNGKVVEPYSSSAFGATIISNTYKDGVGTIEFNAPITTIGEKAFYGCTSLTSITIPDSVTTIGESAFEDCTSLTSVYISDIAAWCNISFSGWYSNPLSNGCNLYLNNKLVTDLTIPDSVTTIGKWAFEGCSSITSITIPDSVTEIRWGAFAYCSRLTSVTIPDSVTTIEDYAFKGCSRLTSVTIGDSVTYIGYFAFKGCSRLTSVTIPDSVTSIAHEAFYDCSSLTSVYCKPITPPDGGYYMFDNNAYGRKIYVPMESVNKYKSASYWKEYADVIVGYYF